MERSLRLAPDAGVTALVALNSPEPSADYLGRAFRGTFNETLTGCIHRRRVDRARMLFRSTDRSIEKVAAEVGFGDVRYFRRIFKRHIGLTPRQFQRLHTSGEPRAIDERSG